VSAEQPKKHIGPKLVTVFPIVTLTRVELFVTLEELRVPLMAELELFAGFE
jgi:hypothetical protein